MKRMIIAVLIFLFSNFNILFPQSNATKIAPANGTAWDVFGTAVIISNNYAFISAPRWLNYAPCGVVYLFKYDNGIWSENDIITPSDSFTLDQFGRSMCINGEYLIIGRPFIAKDYLLIGGAVYVFLEHDNRWVEQCKITSNDSLASEMFAYSVASDGDWIVAGDYMQNNNNEQWAGAAYFFKRDGNSWIEHSKIIASDGKFNDEFGSSVSISGNYVVVGATGVTHNGPWSGAAYIYSYNGNEWQEKQKFSGASAQVSFGHSGCISGEKIAIGAPYGGGTGTVYMYKLENGTWIQDQIISPANGNLLGSFGYSVCLKNDTLIVGANLDNAVYFYKYINGTWKYQNKLVVDDNVCFGESVSFSGNRILVGAPQVDDHGEYSGAAFIYDDLYTGISKEQTNQAIKYNLLQNYPNPFNPTTTIQIELPEKTNLTLSIYDITGRHVKTLVNEEKEAGMHSIIWDGMDDSQKNAGSGVYLCKMATNDGYVEIRRMTLLR